MSTVAAHHHYNPDWLSDDALVANFVARTEEFTFLRGELARAPRKGTVQHYLLVGVRGAGKTTLLKRLAVSVRRDTDLCDHLIALSFPEELYQVKNLSDFWWAACDALADELDHLEQDEQAERLDAAIDKAKSGSEKAPADAGLKLLLQTCAELKRRPVLLVDNLDLVFQRIDKSGRKLKDPHAAAYWELREALSTNTAPIVIGGTVRLSEPFTDYDKAFYDFFIPKRLGKLALEEVRQVLERLADAQDVPEVKQRLHDRPSRIEALFELTGGNPRALGLIFDLLRNGPGSRAVEDFERLMDITTPYYKARFEDMSEQAQVVMHALAVRHPGDGSSLRFGHTAAEIGAYADLPTGTVSAQLDILEREGLVEKSAAHGRTQYRIAEQLFRLWLQMRSTRRIRQNVIDLTKFLEAMFDVEELQAHMGEDNGASPLSDARFAFAVAGAVCAEPLRKGLEAYGMDRLLQHLKVHGGEIGDYLPSGDLSEENAEIARMREQLQKCKSSLSDEEQNALLGSVEMRAEQKQASVQALCNKNLAKKEAASLRSRFDGERQRLLRHGLLEKDLALLFSKRTGGLLPLPQLTPQDAEAACTGAKEKSACRAMVWRLLGARKTVKITNDADAQNWLDWGLKYANEADSTEWANVAGAMRRSKRFAYAQQALDVAIARGESSRAWYELGALLHSMSGNLLEAEAAFRKSIELAPEDGFPWNGLGYLLDDKLKRYEEAEAAYRKSIDINPANDMTWTNLGNLLADKLTRYDEAEVAYREAIKLDATDIWPWFKLGRLLSDKLNRYEEAETAFRKAIDLEPTNANLWIVLSGLLTLKLNRYDEAEAALRKAIELEPADANAWFLLGNLLMLTKRNAEAEIALRKVIELVPEMGRAWFILSLLLLAGGKFNEAIAALSCAEESDAELKPICMDIRINVATLVCTNTVQQALEANNQPALREALSRLLSESADIAASLVSVQFIESFLAQLLKNAQHAKTVLDAMRDLGYEKHARPMLLAFEAALTNRPDMLAELEPEIQGAAKHMFERLIGKKTKKKRAVIKKQKVV
ncbi:MAG: tetratricopeptide repeat protein [Gallionella sp.]|nr:tetratricopeptide repeat protein [Gallionella sp.]